MKKIITSFLLILFFLLVVSLFYSNQKVIEKDIKYYTIPQNYSIYKSKDRRLIIDVYSNEDNSIISFIDKNRYYLIYEHHKIEILDINVSKRKEYSLENESVFVYSFSINVNNILGDIYRKNLTFKIVNEQFQVRLIAGNLTIYSKDYELLNFADLYGNFTYIDNELHMVGITIALDSKYRILNYIEGGLITSNNKNIQKDKIYPPEIDVSDLSDFNIVGSIKNENYELALKEKYYFIPINYEILYLTINPCFIFYIDGKEYLLDNFYYIYNDINLENYNKSKKIGELVYA